MEEPIWDVQELEFELHIDRQLRLLATHMGLDYYVEETLEYIRGLALEYCDELAQESGMYVGINDVLTFLLNDPFEMMIVVDMQQSINWSDHLKTRCTTADGESCSICLDHILLNSEVIQLSCNHTFHPNCIFKWLKVKPECPFCRGPVQKP